MRTESGAAAPAKELVSLADTTDLYATTTSLIDRSAAAFASGLPEGAGDDGFFGARQLYGCGAPPPLTPGRRIEIRQSLRVLAAMLPRPRGPANWA